jgi:hypothetical protein
MPDATGRDMPSRLAEWMQPFRDALTAPTWQHVMVLVMGGILFPGRRAVASALRVTGLDQAPHFTQLPSRTEPQQMVRPLAFLPPVRPACHGFRLSDEPVVIGLDDTIERRWGARIKKRGIYRDPHDSPHSQLPFYCALLSLAFRSNASKSRVKK